METVTINVYLPRERVDVWRPTQAEVLGNGLFRLLPTSNHDPEDEKWEFVPGSIVQTTTKMLAKQFDFKPRLVAVKP